jgi:uncharacterized short protein YbdD (DUF466 family)
MTYEEFFRNRQDSRYGGGFAPGLRQRYSFAGGGYSF